MASYDGFYLTRGHHSNNSSATIHDYTTGRVAWFEHRTKRDEGHNWEGTSNGAESDMLDSILRKVRKEGFILSEIVTDKDSSVNEIYTRHFPEGTYYTLLEPQCKDHVQSSTEDKEHQVHGTNYICNF